MSAMPRTAFDEAPIREVSLEQGTIRSFAG